MVSSQLHEIMIMYLKWFHLLNKMTITIPRNRKTIAIYFVEADSSTELVAN